MYIKQIYTNCLSHAAYYIESEGEAAIIDPLVDVNDYVILAKERGAKISYILETHFHADFVSGHLELARSTGAQIVFGSNAKPNYPVYYAQDNEILTLGKIKFKVLHTPGHTLESVTYLLLDEEAKEHAIFTGDTLFLGDVGRPDLSSGNLSSEELAAYLYDSLQSKIMPLPNDVIVYPAHGAGSACGKKLSDATSSSLGEQKESNYALRAPDKATFIKEVTEGMKTPPAYFFSVAKMNQFGPEHLAISLKKISLEEFDAAKSQNVLVLDSRSKEEFVNGFIPGSINIGLNGRFAPWVGAIIPPESSLILISNLEGLEESIIRLARVGYTNIIGYIDDPVHFWTQSGREVDHIIHQDQFNPARMIIDVRGEEEFLQHHEEGAKNIPIEKIAEQLNLINAPATLVCASGYRAVMAASLVKRAGIKDVEVVY